MATITGDIKQAVTFNQILKVDGINAVTLTASINSDAPEGFSMGRAILSQQLYQKHREELLALQTAFEDTVWAAVAALTDETTSETEAE